MGKFLLGKILLVLSFKIPLVGEELDQKGKRKRNLNLVYKNEHIGLTN